MEAAKVEPYSLYQTFRHNIPEKDLGVGEKKQLSSDVEKLRQTEKNAFLRLILEHARIADGYDSSSGSLPYDGKDTEEGPAFEVENLPRALRWILLRFLKVCAPLNGRGKHLLCFQSKRL